MAQSPLARKLRIAENMKLLTLHAPVGFAGALEPLPSGVTVSSRGAGYAQMHWFVKDRAQLERELDEVLEKLKPGVLCWIYYPKGTSKVQTDLTRDKGWESLLAHTELEWVNLISFDEVWSAFAMRLADPSAKKKPVAEKERPILEYIDAAAKTVRLPEDLEKALGRSKKARESYEKLSYSNKKEYVEWVVTAKREETRTERVKGTIERLEKGWKNPRNL